MRRNTWRLDQLKDLRVSRHWSQEELADLSGLSTRTIQRIEQGHKVDVRSIKLLAQAFETDMDALIGIERNEEVSNDEIKDVRQFYIALSALIVFVVSRLMLAIYNNTGDDAIVWARFFALTVVALCVLSFIAEKKLGKGVTNRFFNRMLGRNTIKVFSQRKSKYLGVVISIIILLMPMIIYMLLSWR